MVSIPIEEIQEIFINIDPLALIALGEDDDIYNKTSESLHRRLMNLKTHISLERLTHTIYLLLSASFTYLNPSFECCKQISSQLNQKYLRKAPK